MEKFRILRVDLKTKTIKEEEFDQTKHGFFGGRGLVAETLTKEVNPKCDALGPDNKLLFCTGYFSGTKVPASNRLSIGAKSPLTGGIKESNSGGTFARRMTDHKIKEIIIENQSENEWLYLYINKDGNAELRSANVFMGKNTYELGDFIRDMYDDRVAIAAIGKAGEVGSLTASIMVSEMLTGYPCRAAARGGMGTVMGSKKLKAVVIEHSDDPFVFQLEPEKQAEFEELNKKVTAAIFANPLTGQTMPLYGSAAGVDTTGKMGALPWNNFNGKFTPGWERLGTVEWRKNLLEHGGHSTIACQPSCTVRCSNEYCDRNGNYLSAGIEYETVALCGSNIGVFDTDVVCTLDRLCDDFGQDTIDTGCALGVAMDYGVLQFGDAETAINMVRTMYDDDATDFQKALRNGCAAVADFLGVDKKEIKKVPTSKRQAFAAYDPRVIRGYGLSWEMGPMGADHTQGSAATYLGNLSPQDQTNVSLAATCTCDCFMCLFPWAAVNFNQEARPAIMRMAALLQGSDENPGAQGVEANGMQILLMEYDFNHHAGMTDADDVFYGGEGNYMYNVGHEATRGGTYWSVQKGPLPAPPQAPAAPAEKKDEKSEEKKNA